MKGEIFSFLGCALKLQVPILAVAGFFGTSNGTCLRQTADLETLSKSNEGSTSRPSCNRIPSFVAAVFLPTREKLPGMIIVALLE